MWLHCGSLVLSLYLIMSENVKRMAGTYEIINSVHIGSKESFLAKLDILQETVQEGYFAFSPEELDAYLRTYAKAGYPMVSHSEKYREAYRPAYRIVQRNLL